MEENKLTVQQVLEMSPDDLRVEIAKIKGWKMGKLYTENHQLLNDKYILTPDYLPLEYVFEETEWDAKVLSYMVSSSFSYAEWVDEESAALELLQEISKQDSQREVNYYANVFINDIIFHVSIESFRRGKVGIRECEYDNHTLIHIDDKDFCIAVCRAYVMWKHDLRTEETWMEKKVREDKEKELKK